MTQKKAIGFGFRGWMLILFQAIAFLTYQVFTQYPLNILNEFYGGARLLGMIYTISAVVGIFIQLLLVKRVAKMKSVKLFSAILGCITLIIALGVATLHVGPLWYVAYALVNIFSVLYATFAIGIIVGQWFPTRKGTVMGIATLTFPIANGMLGVFAGKVMPSVGAFLGMRAMAEMGSPEMAASAEMMMPYSAIFKGFLPFLIISVIGWLLGVIFIKDYPEQVGAFRDNNRDMTPEVATAMMEQEIENKKTTVWTPGHTLRCKEFWFAVIVNSLLLCCAIGLMSQSQAIITPYEERLSRIGGYTGVMMMVMISGMLGSYVLGLLDTRFGTRRAMAISGCLMIIAGVLGNITGSAVALVLAMFFVALFMGASSNFNVSFSAQYWRREDFSSVFAMIAPLASLLGSIAPMVTAFVVFNKNNEYIGHARIFTIVGIAGVLCLILMLIFKPSSIKAMDDKYRTEAGKPLDDALVGRK